MKLPIREQWNRPIFLDDETVTQYSVLQENKQRFAVKYQIYLPTEQELIKGEGDDRQRGAVWLNVQPWTLLH